jgi:hypothetical protein
LALVDALFNVAVDEGLHDRFSSGGLLQQCANGRLVDALCALDEIAQQRFQYFDSGVAVVESRDQRQQLSRKKEVSERWERFVGAASSRDSARATRIAAGSRCHGLT